MTYVIDGQLAVLSAGTALFLPVGSQRIRLASEGNVNFFVFNFSSDSSISLPIILQNAVHGEIFALLTAYDAINKLPTPNKQEKNEHLLACLLTVLEEVATTQSYCALTRTILEYLNQNFRKKITLKEIGDRTFFSPIYCDTVFKRDIGSTVIDYVLTLRMEEAKRLLLEDPLEIRTIAEAVGFSDSNYFSRAFKQRVGCSPSDYRRRYKGSDT